MLTASSNSPFFRYIKRRRENDEAGLKQRIEKEMKRFAPVSDFFYEFQPREINFSSVPDYIEQLKGRPQDASWLGASIVAKVRCSVSFSSASLLQLVFPDTKNYITKLDYNEQGPSVVHTKGY